jgi:hypothetical protein
VILLLSDINQPCQPFKIDSAGERRMKVAIDVVRQRDRETGIASRSNESGSCQSRKPIVVDHEINVQTDARSVQHSGERL